jgi:hypothetical protein
MAFNHEIFGGFADEADELAALGQVAFEEPGGGLAVVPRISPRASIFTEDRTGECI